MHRESSQPAPSRARAWFIGLTLVLVAAACTWPFVGTPGTSDATLWLGWMDDVRSRGPVAGYVDIHADYPPGASLILWVVQAIAIRTGADPRIALKAALFVALVVTAAIFFAASRRAALTCGLYVSLVVNVVGLLYLDILTAPWVVGAVWAAAAGRIPLMFAALMMACFMKWQPLFVVPFACVYLVRHAGPRSAGRGRRDAIVIAAFAAAFWAAVAAIYGAHALTDAFYRASRHNDMSDFGANPLWVLTWLVHGFRRDGVGFRGIVSILPASRPLLRVLTLSTIIGYGWVLRRYWTSTDGSVAGFLRHAIAGYLVYFLISAGVHENHLFLAGLLAFCLAWQDGGWIWAAAAISAAATANLVAFYGWRGDIMPRMTAGIDVTVWLAAVNAIGLLLVARALVRRRAV